VIISPKDLNTMLHKAKGTKPDVDVSIIREQDLVAMLREVKDHRGIAVYRDAEISTGFMSVILLRNYQTFISIKKVASLSQLSEFFVAHGFSGGVASSSEAILIRANIRGKEYAAFYVPPIIEYQHKEKILPPLRRLEERAQKEPSVHLPAYEKKDGDLDLASILGDWRSILSGSQTAIPILKDGTHRSHVARLAGVPIHAIIINETKALMQSVPLRTPMLVLTDGKPTQRSDRFLGMSKIEPDRWEGWIDLASVGIDG
jgi:hypothetical protein